MRIHCSSRVHVCHYLLLLFVLSVLLNQSLSPSPENIVNFTSFIFFQTRVSYYSCSCTCDTVWIFYYSTILYYTRTFLFAHIILYYYMLLFTTLAVIILYKLLDDAPYCYIFRRIIILFNFLLFIFYWFNNNGYLH